MSVVRHRDDGDRRREGGDDDAGDPPFRFRIAASRHLNAITGPDAEGIQRRTSRDRRLQVTPAPQGGVAAQDLQLVDARILGRAPLYDFRHTYCAARLQTLDGDAPVSPYTVGQELGHGGVSLVNRVYGHLGTVRHRSNAVEYRVQQHLTAKHHDKSLREWVKALHQKAA